MRTIQKFSFLFCVLIFGEVRADASRLFVLHNLGETNAMIPVMEKLPEDSYPILAFGKAWEKLKDHPCILKSVLHNVDVGDSLTVETLAKVKASANPKILVTGMASKHKSRS